MISSFLLTDEIPVKDFNKPKPIQAGVNYICLN